MFEDSQKEESIPINEERLHHVFQYAVDAIQNVVDKFEHYKETTHPEEAPNHFLFDELFQIIQTEFNQERDYPDNQLWLADIGTALIGILSDEERTIDETNTHSQSNTPKSRLTLLTEDIRRYIEDDLLPTRSPEQGDEIKRILTRLSDDTDKNNTSLLMPLVHSVLACEAEVKQEKQL